MRENKTKLQEDLKKRQLRRKTLVLPAQKNKACGWRLMLDYKWIKRGIYQKQLSQNAVKSGSSSERASLFFVYFVCWLTFTW